MLPMTKILLQLVKHVSNGIGHALVISPDRAYLRPANNAFQVDCANLKKDTRKIGNDLNKKLKQLNNVESTYQR